MARIFMTGFEDGSLGAFSTVVGSTVSTTQKRTGAYSLRQTGQADYATALFPAAATEIYGRLALYPVSSTDNWPGSFIGFRSGSAEQLSLCWNQADNKIYVFKSGGASAYAAGGVVSPNAWSLIEFYIKSADSPDGAVTIKINGVTILTITGEDTNAGVAGIDAIRIGSTTIYGGSKITVGYIDDIAINNTSGGVNDSWIGQGGIRALLANGAGDHTGLTPSAGSNYQCIDEVPASDADYVSSGTPDDYDLYAVDESTLPAAGTVSAVKWIARAKVVSDAGSIAPVIRSGGTTEEQTTQALSNSFAVLSQIFDVDPIDDSAWTLAKAAALEIGVQVE